MYKLIDVKKIDPSPFQCRKYSDEDKAKELAASIKREGLIEPIVVRRKVDGRYEIIAGHRRVQAVRDYTDWKTIQAQIIKVDDLQARRISAAENLQSKCPKCGFRLSVKEHFLSDFYIGGFALTNCNAILTRDRGVYRKYFPELQNYEPKQ